MTWRECLRTVELEDAAPLAADLFRRRFGKDFPASPRHYVLFHYPGGDAAHRVTVGYIHSQSVDGLHLAGGLCIDERAYRAFPRWLFAQVRDEGGLATILTRESVATLTDGAAVFGYIGDLRSRQSSLRAGFVDTDDDHLMALWRMPLTDEEKKRLTALAAKHSPF